MAFYQKTFPSGNPNDTLVVVSGKTGCCGDSATEQSWDNSAFDIGGNTITGIVIDGTQYDFEVPADDQDKLRDGIIAAFKSAGYVDIENAGLCDLRRCFSYGCYHQNYCYSDGAQGLS